MALPRSVKVVAISNSQGKTFSKDCESAIRPSSERVTTCLGMNLEMLPISNVAISNVQFQLATYSVKLGAFDNRHFAAHEVAVERGV